MCITSDSSNLIIPMPIKNDGYSPLSPPTSPKILKKEEIQNSLFNQDLNSEDTVFENRISRDFQNDLDANTLNFTKAKIKGGCNTIDQIANILNSLKERIRYDEKNDNFYIFQNSIKNEPLNHELIEKIDNYIKSINLIREEFNNEIEEIKNQVSSIEQKKFPESAPKNKVNLGEHTETINDILKNIKSLEDHLKNETKNHSNKTIICMIVGLINLLSVMLDSLFTMGILSLSSLIISAICTFLSISIILIEGTSEQKEIDNDFKNNSISHIKKELKEKLGELQIVINEIGLFYEKQEEKQARRHYAEYLKKQRSGQSSNCLIINQNYLFTVAPNGSPMSSHNPRRSPFRSEYDSLNNPHRRPSLPTHLPKNYTNAVAYNSHLEAIHHEIPEDLTLEIV